MENTRLEAISIRPAELNAQDQEYGCAYLANVLRTSCLKMMACRCLQLLISSHRPVFLQNHSMMYDVEKPSTTTSETV